MPDDRSRVSSGSPYEPVVGFSRAVRVGERVLVAGTAPVWPAGEEPPDSDDPYVQASRCWEIVVGALAELGSRPADVVRTRMFLTSPDYVDAVSRAHVEVFGDVRPAATMVVVAALVDPRWRVEVEAEAQIAAT